MEPLVTRDAFAVVEATGDDAWKWWSGQVTSDTTAAESGQRASYGLVLNARGRIVSDALTFPKQADGAVRVSVPASRVEALLTHLEHYIIMEDVVVARATTLCVEAGFGAPAGQTALESPRFGYAEARGWEALVPTQAVYTGDNTPNFLSAMTANGIPICGVDFGEDTYPHEVGLDKKAVSFTKGCYLGQEVVCMLESRGHASRSLRRWEADHDCAVGENVFVRAAAGGAIGAADEVGQIRSSVVLNGGRWTGFVLLRTAALASATQLVAAGHSIRLHA